MLYFKMINDKCEGISRISPADFTNWTCRAFVQMNTFEKCEAIAKAATEYHEAFESADTYIAIDAGPNVSPRYDVIRCPKVGDKVSYSFNGDTYPDGEIKSISKSLRVIKTTPSEGRFYGNIYYRRGLSGSWIKDRTWTLVQGHIDERNPSF